MEESGSLEGRVRRLESETAAQRRELSLLRRRLGGALGLPPDGGTAAQTRPARGVGFDAFETVSGAEVGDVSGADTPSELNSGLQPAGGALTERVIDVGYEATFGPEVEASASDGSGGWGTWLRLDLAGMRGWEWWLNKVGIALLLFGVAFLFKFSWDRGWLQELLTPWVRVGLGAGLGCALIVLGLRTDERRGFAAVLLGGGVGTLYITCFAAYGVLDLIPHAAAFAAMAGVTVLAFALSVGQDEPVLSIIAAVGGFATPFALYTDDGSVAGLVLYTSLLLAGTAAIYLWRGWRSLLVVSAVGAWSVLWAAVAQGGQAATLGATEWALQAGVAFAWLTLWLVPAAREVLRGRDPDAWPLPQPGLLAPTLEDAGDRSSVWLSHALSFGTPLLALMFTDGIWSLEDQALGYLALTGAGIYAGAALILRRVERGGDVSYVSGLVAAVLATFGIVALFEGDTLFAALALEATALHFVARRFSDTIVRWAAHALYGVVFSWLGIRLLAGILDHLLEPPGGWTDLPGIDALADLAVIALLPLLARFEARSGLGEVYHFVACGAFSVWMARELLVLQDGVSYLVLAWALYAVGLLASSRKFRSIALAVAVQVQLVALGTLVLGRLLYTLAFGPEGTPVFNLAGTADLLAVVVIGGFSLFPPRPGLAVPYRLVAHATLLTWFWGQLSSLPSGDAYVTIAWGLSGAALLMIGLRASFADLVHGGLVTLFLVVGKLFLWDLAWVEAIWRVLLFLGFGGLFLLLSYYLPSLWRGADGEGLSLARGHQRHEGLWRD